MSWPTRTPRWPSTCGPSRRRGTRPTTRRPAATRSPASSSATCAAAATAANGSAGLIRWPGDGGPVVRRERGDPVLEEQLDPLPGGRALGRRKPPVEGGAQFVPGHRLLQPEQRLDGGPGEMAAPPLPEHRAELVLLAEADPVVASVQVSATVGQQMPDLPVGVVHDRVEDGHLPQRRVVLATGERDDVDGLVRLDPQLAHAAH